jgi:hypothetical protein
MEEQKEEYALRSELNNKEESCESENKEHTYQP